MSYGSYFTTDVNEYVIIISQIDCPRCGVCSGWMAAGSEGGNERRRGRAFAAAGNNTTSCK